MVRVEFTNTRLSLFYSHKIEHEERIKGYGGYTLSGDRYVGKYDTFIPVVSKATLEGTKHRWSPSGTGQPYVRQSYSEAVLNVLNGSHYLFIYTHRGKLKAKILSPDQTRP